MRVMQFILDMIVNQTYQQTINSTRSSGRFQRQLWKDLPAKHTFLTCLHTATIIALSLWPNS